MPQMESVDVTVIVPVFNNAPTLDSLLDRIIAAVAPVCGSFEIVCVDDGSRDESLALLRRRASNDPRLRPIALRRNYGIQAAACAAFDHARGARIVSIDADLENQPEDIPTLLRQLDAGYDLVCGYRTDRRAPLLRRRLPSALMNRYVRRVTGAELRDVACGLKAMQRHVVEDLGRSGEARRFLTPLLLQRARNYTEVAVRHRPRPHGRGHSMRGLAGIALDYFLFSARRPFVLAGVLALATAFAALPLAALATLEAGVGLACAAFLAGIAALVGELAQRVYWLRQDVPFYELRRAPEGELDSRHATRA